jgi:ornithine carbamoyltransferase
MKKDFLTLLDFSKEELLAWINRAAQLKLMRKKNIPHQPLKGKTLGMIFNKPSTRTRISFEVGMVDLGGHPLFLTGEHLQLKRGETLADSARVLSRYLDGILIRTFDHKEVTELARHAAIPVINGLTDLSHPVQVLSDLFTIYEKIGRVKNIKVAYIGDGNNVTYSWMEAAAIFGFHLAVGAPPACRPKAPRSLPKNGKIEFLSDPLAAAKNADILYTDVWVSMGQEAQTRKKMKQLQNYRIDRKLVNAAKKTVLVMHCLPAHRDQEISSEVLDGPNSVVLDQAENRLHLQKAILEQLLSGPRS